MMTTMNLMIITTILRRRMRMLVKKWAKALERVLMPVEYLSESFPSSYFSLSRSNF